MQTYIIADSAWPLRANRLFRTLTTQVLHNYQRFTGTLAGKDVPFIFAGAGGYNLRLHILSKAFHNAKLPVEIVGSGIAFLVGG
jgi:hypothetical protein